MITEKWKVFDMRVIVDAFGGDNAPLAVLEGCAAAVAEYGVDIMLVGDKGKITACAKEHNISLKKMEIAQADDIMDMHDDPSEIIKSKAGTSLAVGLQKLRDGEGDCFVSAGSTAALIMGATFIVKRIKGIKRPALAPVMPSAKGPFMLIDCGANLEARPDVLTQFGLMGSLYMNKVMKVHSPRVGLLNVGAEDTKGGDNLVETYHRLENAPLNFVGNVEPRDVPDGACDVLVCDGFSGNIVLKLTEGVAGFFMGTLKTIFKKNLVTKLAAAMIMPGLKGLKKKMDYTEYGGAPLMGVSKPVVKAHGSSNASAYKNAVGKAVEFAGMGVIEAIGEELPILMAKTQKDETND